MILNDFLEQARSLEPISFQQTIQCIEQHYHYQPAEFSNGQNNQIIINQAGTNEGSCKIFAFAQLHQLNQQQTLNLFGEFYQDVLNDPDGTGHQNIRHFMMFGWEGITFQSSPLSAK